MDSHDVARGRGDYEDVLRTLLVPTLLVAIDSDVLYPPAELEELAELLPDASLATLRSLHGHDAFLIAGDEVDAIVRAFLAGAPAPRRPQRRRAAAGARAQVRRHVGRRRGASASRRRAGARRAAATSRSWSSSRRSPG